MSGIFGKVTSKNGLPHFAKVAERSILATNQEIQLATLKVHETAVRSIQENTDGESQTRYDPLRTVNVSDPGDPPNTDTGRLVKSIRFEFEEDKGSLTGIVGTNLIYGLHLELGTSKMKARPWLMPALVIGRKDLLKAIKKRLQLTLKGEE